MAVAVRGGVGDPGDRLARHRRPVDLGEMRGDLPVVNPFRIQRQHDLIDIGQPPLPFLDDLRFERSFPVSRHVDNDFSGGVGDHRLRPRPVAHIRGLPNRVGLVFGCPRCRSVLRPARFQHVLGEQLQQPVRAGQLQPTSLRLGHHRRRGGLPGRRLPPGLVVTLAWTHSVGCRHSRCPSPGPQTGVSGRNTVRYTVPRGPCPVTGIDDDLVVHRGQPGVRLGLIHRQRDRSAGQIPSALALAAVNSSSVSRP